MLSNGSASSTSDTTASSELSPFTTGTRLRELTRVALREALHGDVSGRVPDGTVRRVIRELCEEAHACGARVEHVIILLKDARRELPEVRRANRDDAEDTLSRVITLCIDEYYGPPRPF